MSWGRGSTETNLLTLPQFISFHLCIFMLLLPRRNLFLSHHPSIFLHLLVLAVGSGEASEALVGLCLHRKKTFRDLKNREALVIAIRSLQPRVQGPPQTGRPTWKRPLGPQTHQLLEASVHRLGGLDGIEKPFPLCVTCYPFFSPGQVVVYPLHQMGPPSAELCHRWSIPPRSGPTSLLLPCSLAPSSFTSSPVCPDLSLHFLGPGSGGLCLLQTRAQPQGAALPHTPESFLQGRRASQGRGHPCKLLPFWLFSNLQKCAFEQVKKKSVPPPTNDTISQARRADVGRQIGL